MCKTLLDIGCLDIWIDDIVPCLIDTQTKEELDTAVFRVESRSYLDQFREDNGWHINWIDVPQDVEVYALALKESNEIQGLVALKNDLAADAIYIHWACTAPHNNIHEFGKQKYSGVGGHLFAIAADKSFEYGHKGFIHGFARNKELVVHYCNQFGAKHIAALHQFQIMIDTTNAKKLMEVYKYEWENSEVLGREIAPSKLL